MGSGWFDNLYRRYSLFIKFTGCCAGFATLAMMFLVGADIIGRKFFNAPIEGTYEITEGLLTFAIYTGVAYTQLERSHVRVTLFTDRLSPKGQSVVLATVYIIGFVFFACVSYCMFCFAWDSWLVRELKWGTVEYPLYPVKAIAGAGVFLLGIQFLLDAVREVLYPGQEQEGSH